MFEENSTRHFDAKIYSNISIKFALKKVALQFLFHQSISYFMSAYLHQVSLDPRLNGCNAKIY